MKNKGKLNSLSGLFVEEGDKKVFQKMQEKTPEGSSKIIHQAKKIVKLPLHFLFDGLKVHRSFSKLKPFDNINLFKGPIDRIYNIVFGRKIELKNAEKESAKKSIEELDPDLRIKAIKTAQTMAVFFTLVLFAIVLITLFSQTRSFIVYLNIGLSCLVVFLFVISRLKDAYVLKYAEFNQTDVFNRRFWSFSTGLGPS